MENSTLKKFGSVDVLCLMFQIFSSYHFDAIVLEREFPLDLYPWRNETDVSSTKGTATKNYDFLNSLFPIGILIIILIFVFICTRRNVCLLKSWGKWNKFARLARDWSSKFVTDKWSFYDHYWPFLSSTWTSFTKLRFRRSFWGA